MLYNFYRWLIHLANPLRRIFSYNNGFLILYSVYFSVTFTKSKQKKKVKRKTFRYKYDALRRWSAIYFLTKVYFECALIWNAQVNVNSCTVHYGSIQYTT